MRCGASGAMTRARVGGGRCPTLRSRVRPRGQRCSATVCMSWAGVTISPPRCRAWRSLTLIRDGGRRGRRWHTPASISRRSRPAVRSGRSADAIWASVTPTPSVTVLAHRRGSRCRRCRWPAPGSCGGSRRPDRRRRRGGRSADGSPGRSTRPANASLGSAGRPDGGSSRAGRCLRRSTGVHDRRRAAARSDHLAGGDPPPRSASVVRAAAAGFSHRRRGPRSGPRNR